MTLLEELKLRGLVQDVTNQEALSSLLESERVIFYDGFDPTATTLHAGTLVGLSLLVRLQRAGHKPIAVVGGATGMIGDPSGKSEERKLLDPSLLAENVQGLKAQLARFLRFDDSPSGALLVNNADWFASIGYLAFLRDVGKHITVNYMLAKESVRARLEDREQGISYTEFSYMLLQAYDFVHLNRTYGCRLQIGGSDQWGNITCGTELHRKVGGEGELFGLVTPLLLTAAGKKFGKSEAGTSVWLDPEHTSPYAFYQFWINTDDADVERYLKMFTFRSLDEIASAVAEHDQDRAKRLAQKRLAEEVTTWVHGPDAARRARAASQVMFGGSLADLKDADLEPLCADVPTTTLARAALAAGLLLLDLLVSTKLCESKGAARRLLAQGGVYVNNVRTSDPERVLCAGDLATESMLILRAGKKSYHVIKLA
jgi:tyrosyl-tRNA synthetase